MNTIKPLFTNERHPFSQLDVYYEEDCEALWYYMHASPRPCFTTVLLNDIYQLFDDIEEISGGLKAKYCVLASEISGVFNLGGDLNRFVGFIRQGNRQGLLDYAKACVEVLYLNHTGLGKGITTISLVQGDALGGGFEAAISSDVLIAERSAKMGFPEILFNLFPGMGAFSFLSRKIGNAQAEKMILSGRLYSAEELFDLGVVDVLAEDGHGEKEVYDYISREDKARNGITAFRAARKRTQPLTYGELQDVTEIWVDAALKLRDKDLRMMERLVQRQASKSA